jgi:hypothetical protein
MNETLMINETMTVI